VSKLTPLNGILPLRSMSAVGARSLFPLYCSDAVLYVVPTCTDAVRKQTYNASLNVAVSAAETNIEQTERRTI
jgi:hypothetical protein